MKPMIVKGLRRSVSSVLFMMILSACSQAALTPLEPASSQGQSSTAARALASAQNQPVPSVVSSSQASAIAQTPTAPTMATDTVQQHLAGFSANGQYFMMLESWRDTGAGIPHAAMQIVQLPSNTCVPQGCLRTRFTEAQASQSLASAENDLLQKTQSLRQALQLTEPRSGQSLPVLTRSQAADGTEHMTVQLPNNQPLHLTLKQTHRVVTTNGAEKEQAAMQLEISYNGSTRSLGSLDQMQDWMVEFSIRDVQRSPDGKTIAILVTGTERAFEGTLGRTLVQGLAL